MTSVERVVVGHQLGVRPLVEVLDQHLHHHRQQVRPVHRGAHDLLAAQDRGRVDRHRAASHDVADLDERAAVGEVLEALDQQLGAPDQLHHIVRAAPVRELEDAVAPRLEAVVLVDVDRVVGAELLGEREALGDAVEHDHAMRAHVLRHRGRVEAEAARALDDDVVALAEAAAQQALGDGAHRAVDPAEHGVGQLVRHLVDGVVRGDPEVVGVGAGEVGPIAGDASADAGLAVGAPVVLAAAALVAVVAGEDRRVHHAVALLERAAERVRAATRAEAPDHAGALVAHVLAGRRERDVDLVAAPGVEVRAADTGLRHPQDHATRLRLGDLVLLDGERLVVLLDDDDSAGGHALLLRGASRSA